MQGSLPADPDALPALPPDATAEELALAHLPAEVRARVRERRDDDERCWRELRAATLARHRAWATHGVLVFALTETVVPWNPAHFLGAMLVGAAVGVAWSLLRAGEVVSALVAIPAYLLLQMAWILAGSGQPASLLFGTALVAVLASLAALSREA